MRSIVRLIEPGFRVSSRCRLFQSENQSHVGGFDLFPQRTDHGCGRTSCDGQLLESTLLNVEFSLVGRDERLSIQNGRRTRQKLYEFGLRQAQGPDGAISASRYAYIGDRQHEQRHS